MIRNKKNDSSPPLGTILLAVTLCLVFAGLGVGYVWNKDQIDLLGRQIKLRELRLAELQRQNQTRRAQLASLSSAVPLDGLVKKLNLGLGPPALSQIIRIVDSLDFTPLQRPSPLVLVARKN